MTTDEQGEMKPGLRLSIGYVLKKLIKIMKGHYVMKDCMKAAEEVDLFNSVLQMNWDYIFFSWSPIFDTIHESCWGNS